MRPGDVCIAHQRLAHAGGINLSAATRKTVYFRVRHKLHNEFLDKYLKASEPFVGFEGLQDLVKGD